MDKNQVLALVQEKLNDGTITRDDLGTLSGTPARTASQSHTITNILYIIGGIIAMIGVVILVAQYWTEIGFVGRVLSTLGISVISYAIAFMLAGPIHRVLSQVLFTLSGILAPLGVFVFLREFNISFTSLVQVFTALALLGLFATAFVRVRRNILVLWGCVWATWAYFAFLNRAFDLSADLLKLSTMVWGIALGFVAYYFQQNVRFETREERKEKGAVEGITYGVATLMFLMPALFFGGLFDFVTLLLIFAAFYASVFIRSKLVLAVSGVMLMAYIIKITSKYFVDSVGWPLALIVAGFMVIAIGYGTVYVGRTYISKPTV